jgi:hypothetical protein
MPVGLARWALDWMLFWFWATVASFTTLALLGLLALFGAHTPWQVWLCLWRALFGSLALLVGGTFAFAMAAATMERKNQKEDR